MNALKWIVLLSLTGYVAFVVALYFGQRTMLYFPRSTPVSPAAAGLPEAEEVVLTTSDIAASMYPIVPVRWLMHDQYHSDQRIGKVKASILILHGAQDMVVPIKFGERLFALAPEPKRFVRFPAGGHNDLEAFGAGAEARRFITEPVR